MEVDETAEIEVREQYFDCPQRALQEARQEANTVVQTVTDSSHQFDLVDARNPENILVRHKSRSANYTVHLGHVSISPSGTYMAYVVQGGSGGWVNPSRGYVLDVTAKNASPRLLGASVYGPIKWSPDSTVVYASLDDAIYQWDVRMFR
ncbi:MAG TPA: hypothetical protein VJL83_04780 [Patescibacteria group bacterium]|nr:MAG: hypothetical protein A2752_03760 [Candidatus Uhrbacteria bacterium RIFCSPHIGHO2_01_FULL_46_23]HLB60890.1 hypothetical protein [Patescibacteria group bacterium]